MSERAAQPTRQITVPGGGWPLDDQGNPMALVGFQASELIGLPNYSNVTVGPAMVMRYVKDDPAARQFGIRECVKEAESVIAEERQLVYEQLKNASGSK